MSLNEDSCIDYFFIDQVIMDLKLYMIQGGLLSEQNKLTDH